MAYTVKDLIGVGVVAVTTAVGIGYLHFNKPENPPTNIFYGKINNDELSDLVTKLKDGKHDVFLRRSDDVLRNLDDLRQQALDKLESEHNREKRELRDSYEKIKSDLE